MIKFVSFYFNILIQHGQTPLHFASYSGMVDTVMELVQLGGDINGRDQVTNIPLKAVFIISTCRNAVIKIEL